MGILNATESDAAVEIARNVGGCATRRTCV